MKISRRFNDQEYIDNYLTAGEFPRIHDEIAGAIAAAAPEREPCFDLGSNIGLLSIRSLSLGRSHCVGIEGFAPDFQRAVPHPGVRYENFYITRETFPRLESLLDEVAPTLVIARRVVSEIGSKEPAIVKEMAGIFYSHGVKKIALQGRVRAARPTVPLYITELEAACFEKYYSAIHTTRNCVVMGV
jgi:hypothetical protein